MISKMKKIKFYFLSINLLLLTLVAPYFAIADTSISDTSGKPDTITFIHVTDPHVCNLTGYHPFFIEKRLHFGNNAEPLTQFFKSIPGKYQSDFVVITGDNIDYYEAQTEKDGTLDTQIEQYSRLLDASNVPVYLTLGNHDIASYFVSPLLAYTNNQFNAGQARAAWMRNVPCFKDGTYYSRIFKIDTTTFRFIFLDNSYYGTKELTDESLPFLIDQSQLLWLDAQLKTSASDIEIIFMHMPLSNRKQDDKSILTEQLSTYSTKSKFYNLFSVLEKNSSTRLLFVGHNHNNIINNYILPNGNKLTQVMTGAFGYNPNDWRIIKLTNNKIIICSSGSSETEYTIPIL